MAVAQITLFSTNSNTSFWLLPSKLELKTGSTCAAEITSDMNTITMERSVGGNISHSKQVSEYYIHLHSVDTNAEDGLRFRDHIGFSWYVLWMCSIPLETYYIPVKLYAIADYGNYELTRCLLRFLEPSFLTEHLFPLISPLLLTN